MKLTQVNTMNAIIASAKAKRGEDYGTKGSIIKTSQMKEIWAKYASQHGAGKILPVEVLERIKSCHGLVDLSLWPLDGAMTDESFSASEVVDDFGMVPTNAPNYQKTVVIDSEKLMEQYEIRVETLGEMIDELNSIRNANDAVFAFVSGDAGFGKTHTVMQHVGELENAKTEYVGGAHLTDIALFELFERNCEKNNIIVLDDVTLSMSKTCLNILKGAMQTKASLRCIEWITADEVRKVAFHGSLIWLANERLQAIRAAKAASMAAVLSRFPTVIDLSIPLQARIPLVIEKINHGLLNSMGIGLAFDDEQSATVTEIIVERIKAETPSRVNFRYAENLLRAAMRTLSFDDHGLVTESLDKFERRLSVNAAMEIA